MNLKKIVEDLGMHVKTGADNLDVTGGYASDLLSVEKKICDVFKGGGCSSTWGAFNRWPGSSNIFYYP